MIRNRIVIIEISSVKPIIAIACVLSIFVLSIGPTNIKFVF